MSHLFWHQHCFVEPFNLFLASLSSSSPAAAVTATSSSSSFSWHQRCLSEPLNLFLAAPLLVQPLIQDSTTATDRLRSYPNSNKLSPRCVILHLTLCHGQRKDLKKGIKDARDAFSEGLRALLTLNEVGPCLRTVVATGQFNFLREGIKKIDFF